MRDAVPGLKPPMTVDLYLVLFLALVNDNLLLRSMHDTVPGLKPPMTVDLYLVLFLALVNDNLLLRLMREAVPGSVKVSNALSDASK